MKKRNKEFKIWIVSAGRYRIAFVSKDKPKISEYELKGIPISPEPTQVIIDEIGFISKKQWGCLKKYVKSNKS